MGSLGNAGPAAGTTGYSESGTWDGILAALASSPSILWPVLPGLQGSLGVASIEPLAVFSPVSRPLKPLPSPRPTLLIEPRDGVKYQWGGEGVTSSSGLGGLL